MAPVTGLGTRFFVRGSHRSDWIPTVTLSVSCLRMKIDVRLGCSP